jgi:hypothetical protein
VAVGEIHARVAPTDSRRVESDVTVRRPGFAANNYLWRLADSAEQPQVLSGCLARQDAEPAGQYLHRLIYGSVKYHGGVARHFPGLLVEFVRKGLVHAIGQFVRYRLAQIGKRYFGWRGVLPGGILRRPSGQFFRQVCTLVNVCVDTLLSMWVCPLATRPGLCCLLCCLLW